MAREYFVTGLDIGNTAIKAVALSFNAPNTRPKVAAIGIGPSSGLRRGMIIDMEETTKEIAAVLKQIQQNISGPAGPLYVSVNGPNIHTQFSRGVIAVSRADNQISENDMERVIEAASAVSLSSNREILHIIPRFFVVDGQTEIKNPIGMNGVRLEAEVMLVEVLSPHLRNLAKCIELANAKVAEFIFAPLAVSRAVLDKKAREHGVMVLDFGGGLCSLAIFEESDLVHTGVIPFGSRHITNDLAIVLRTSLDNAEQIKIQHAISGPDVSKKEEIDLSDILGEEDYYVSKKQIAEVVNARIFELLDLVRKEIRKSGRLLLPAGVVLTGGGMKLPGFMQLVKNTLELPVHLGLAQEVDGLAHSASDPILSTAFGLALWGRDKQRVYEPRREVFNFLRNTAVLNKLREWFKGFMP